MACAARWFGPASFLPQRARRSTSRRVRDTENSLEKVKRQLSSGSGRYLLQWPLLKRSETLRKWNERWVILDPTSGKMEYKLRRNETAIKGTILFDASNTITLSSVNFQGMPKYDCCCFYIGTPQKKDYFLCAETPGAAKAWVSTLHATQLVLGAHKEAVNSLAGNGSAATLGTVATAVAHANAVEIEAALKVSMRAALGLGTNNSNEGQLDDLTIMKKAIFGLLRICKRLLPYKENLADELLRSLQLVLKLDARVADAYCENITQEVARLVKANAAHIKSQMGWRTVILLLSITARLLEISQNHSQKDYRNMEGFLVLAMKLVAKVYLQFLPDLFGLSSF